MCIRDSYSIYVKNTLLLFFESHQVSYDRMDSYFRSLSSNVAPALEYRRLSFSNLASLLEQLISKIRRYGTIYFMNGLQPVPICNYRGLISKMEQLTSYLPVSYTHLDVYKRQATSSKFK